mmetsp:Transcript_9759/g.11035  ORF Transcript_9759/g.11035 Transcript_9759/m.11035 type:complete len:177 (-) Transcript_9759:733-1263(-)
MLSHTPFGPSHCGEVVECYAVAECVEDGAQLVTKDDAGRSAGSGRISVLGEVFLHVVLESLVVYRFIRFSDGRSWTATSMFASWLSAFVVLISCSAALFCVRAQRVFPATCHVASFGSLLVALCGGWCYVVHTLPTVMTIVLVAWGLLSANLWRETAKSLQNDDAEDQECTAKELP